MPKAPSARSDRVGPLLDAALEAGGGVLRLAPTWVPRSFLQPGRRLKLAPDDYYALGAQRGGIDERWFASTTEATNEGRAEDEGLSYVVFDGKRFLLRDAIASAGATLIGRRMFEKHRRWPVYAKFFDNLGPIPHHMHQSFADAARTGQQGKPEAYYFPTQLNNVEHRFAHTFFGLEPGTTRDDVKRCLAAWDRGDNGILDLSRAYRLKLGTGWLVPPGILHAPGSLLTYEPQWGSDVFGMFQSMVEGREVPWSLLVRDVPKEKRRDLDYIVGQLDWDANVDTRFKEHHYLEPVVDATRAAKGVVDRWIVYGRVDGEQLFSAKELTLDPGARWTLQDPGASGWVTVQGRGRIGTLDTQTPAMIRFGAETQDEFFVSHAAAASGVEIENTGSEPLVSLRYFGPDVHASVPKVGDHRNAGR